MDLIEKKEANPNIHPWEISRAKSILRLVKNISENAQLADVGAGDMYFTKYLCNLTNRPIYAVDTEYVNPQITEKIIQLRDISQIPLKSIDCMFLMDVLEHVQDEKQFLDLLLERIKDNGMLIVTVPAYQFLFSSHDKFLKHYRRYNRKQLVKLLEENGLRIAKSFYFYTTLFIIRLFDVILYKFISKRPHVEGIGNWKHGRRSILTRTIEFILKWDFDVHYHLERIGIQIAGLSLCVICQKRSF